MLKRHEVQVLLKAGHTRVESARLAGVSVSSVKRIAEESAVKDVEDSAERARRGIGRPSRVERFRGFVEDVLRELPLLPSHEILRRAKLEGYHGGKSALYGLIASVRPKPVDPLVRFEGLPGEFSQHDFGQVDVEYLDGTIERARFFASRLKYSRLMRVSLVKDETVETLVRNLADHLDSWGGAPLMCVFDRPKTVAIHWKKNGEVTEWNSSFAYAALELGVGVELCWPYRPQEKGSVENLVGFVKNSFFKVRRFRDRDDLTEQLAEWLSEVNEQRPCRATNVIPALRWGQERPRLRPLKVTPEKLALRIPVQIGPTSAVFYDGHTYSMPPLAAGRPATLYLYRDRVRIVADPFEATHPRQSVSGKHSILAEHRAAMLAAVSGKRGKRYLKRQQILDLGETALLYLTEVVHRRPREWVRDVDRLHDILQAHGEQALRDAMQDAMARELFGATYVEQALQRSITFPAVLQ
jgi:transposase